MCGDNFDLELRFQSISISTGSQTKHECSILNIVFSLYFDQSHFFSLQRYEIDAPSLEFTHSAIFATLSFIHTFRICPQVRGQKRQKLKRVKTLPATTVLLKGTRSISIFDRQNKMHPTFQSLTYRALCFTFPLCYQQNYKILVK